MRRGFSLLEVVLAIGILGCSLPILLTHMAESTGKMEKRMQEVLVANAGKNTQNVLNVLPKAPPLDANDQAYCGHRNGIFTIANAAMGFDEAIFVLVRKAVENAINGSVNETTYTLYPWDSQNQRPRLTLPHVEVKQYIVTVSLGTIALINKAVLGDILAMQEGVAKAKASWAYASVSESSYGHNKEYGAAQIFEYTSHVNKNYINSIAGNDAIAQNYAQELYNALTSGNNDRLSNWNKLKQDPILGAVMAQTMNAQFAVIDAMKNAEGGSLREAQEAIQEAVMATWSFISSDGQYEKDYENTVNAYQAVYDYFVANPNAGEGNGPAIFKNNLNGTAANSYGAMAAAILMSLGSTQNILDAYLSEK